MVSAGDGYPLAPVTGRRPKTLNDSGHSRDCNGAPAIRPFADIRTGVCFADRWLSVDDARPRSHAHAAAPLR